LVKLTADVLASIGREILQRIDRVERDVNETELRIRDLKHDLQELKGTLVQMAQVAMGSEIPEEESDP